LLKSAEKEEYYIWNNKLSHRREKLWAS
jgi:hypothetical protein